MRILLIEADAARRVNLTCALQATEMAVAAVESVGEIERWPHGGIVVTDYARFTPWWKAVGARHVLVLADTPADGLDACARGATAWVPRACNPDVLIGALRECAITPACHGEGPPPPDPDTR